MKEIKLIKGYVISAFNGPTESITPKLMDDIMKPVERNKFVILDAAFDIERMLDRIIAHHFFGDHEINKQKSIEFGNQILKSDWCSFSSKRKLMSHIINDQSILQGQDKNDYEGLLKKTMSYRNAFAHGELSTDGREVRLTFFEGSPKAKILTDDYLSSIETDLKQCFDITFKVAIKSGANKVIEHPKANDN